MILGDIFSQRKKKTLFASRRTLKRRENALKNPCVGYQRGSSTANEIKWIMREFTRTFTKNHWTPTVNTQQNFTTYLDTHQRRSHWNHNYGNHDFRLNLMSDLLSTRGQSHNGNGTRFRLPIRPSRRYESWQNSDDTKIHSRRCSNRYQIDSNHKSRLLHSKCHHSGWINR